jgi:predicted metalloprotease
VQESRPVNPEEEEFEAVRVSGLAKSEDVWTEVFRQNGRQLSRADAGSLCRIASDLRAGLPVRRLVLSTVPGDQKVYIDLSFLRRAAATFQRARVILRRRM